MDDDLTERCVGELRECAYNSAPVAVEKLTGALDSNLGCAGTDSAGKTWSDSYDTAEKANKQPPEAPDPDPRWCRTDLLMTQRRPIHQPEVVNLDESSAAKELPPGPAGQTRQ